MVDMSFLLADEQFYEPWDVVDPGPRYRAGPMPEGWTTRTTGAWTHWSPARFSLPDQGWKVHVSSSLDNAPAVLAVVSSVCLDFAVGFKHLAGRQMFLLLHDKHAARVQAGKFCTIYPPDESAAAELMRRLSAELAGIGGPFVLTDRRFEDSDCISYRYGAFRSRQRVDADGYQIDTMLAPDGTEVDDDRLPEFRLPPGLRDPFREPRDAKPADGPVTVHGYAFDKVVQHSNSGGAYLFRSPDGEAVFVKEAKSFNGYTGDGADAQQRLNFEYLVLRAIQGRQPGLCPRPVELFRHWEHTYLVTELVPGISLYRWMVTNHPVLRTAAGRSDFAEYYRRGLALLDDLATQLERLHHLGFVFIDLSPTNVMVDEDDRVRLIDFEAVQRIDGVRQIMGTPGYLHPDPKSVIKTDPRELDRYGLSALALLLLFPAHEAAEWHPGTLAHLHADLAEFAPVEPRLWQWATSYHDRCPSEQLPTPVTVRADTRAELCRLADRTADCLQAMADPAHPARVYPTNPLGYQTNTRALAAGTAGVLLALQRAGRDCDPAVVRRLRTESLAAAEASAPGWLVGSAGIAGVLAEIGEQEAAETLLTAAAGHPMNRTVATLTSGSAGTAYGLLEYYRRTGEQRWLDLAAQLLDAIPSDESLSGQLSRTNQSGLVGGRTGVALALHRLYEHTGDERLFDRGIRLLTEELRFAEPIPTDGLGFKTSSRDRRVYPYLFAGSAGYAEVLSRYLTGRPDLALGESPATEVLEQCLRACQIRLTAFPGLMPGLMGLAMALAGVGRRLRRPELIESAFISARGLFRFAVPRDDGIGWLGEPGQRLSTDLWSGSAGVLFGLKLLTDPELIAGLGPELIGSRELVTPRLSERRDRHGGSAAFAG